jgi:hypothetical protein
LLTVEAVLAGVPDLLKRGKYLLAGLGVDELGKYDVSLSLDYQDD